jgi:GLPGLI family protein
MIKKCFLILFFSIPFILFSQKRENYNIIVDYDIYYNTERPNVKSGKLTINGLLDKSIFVYGQKGNKDVKIKKGNEISVQFRSSIRFNYFDFKKNVLSSKEKVINDEFIVKEKIPIINWVLLDEKKSIGDLNVRKAIANYRGRKYIAWYSDKYQLKFGPWKFSGLPGLIIEIYDETKRYHWIMKSIRKNKTGENDFKIGFDTGKEISIKEYVVLRYDKKVELINRSKLPRGTKVEVGKINRNGIELIFEWEKEKKGH